DAATAEVVLMVLGGKVNRQLVAALQRQGVDAVGISGADGATFTAAPLLRAGVDLGFVGQVGSVDPGLVNALLAAGFVPVLATVAPAAPAADGAEPADPPFYNLNADHAAGPLAAAFGCDALLFLTDVPGVLGRDGEVLAALSERDCAALIAAGVARGGMLPKLEAATMALRDNPNARIVIAPADGDDCVRRALQPGTGTRFVTAEETA
ncbi:MAG: acetylglutamate kinase, partial [Planctomycetes bacterium]|nr:acetylglutamate kinase [Planctomycetota bacterium]